MPSGSSVATTSFSLLLPRSPTRRTATLRTLCRRPISSISLTAGKQLGGPSAGAHSPDQARVDVGNLRNAGQRHVASELALQDLERLCDPSLDAGTEPVEMWPPGGTGARTESERFQYVCAAAHSAVENHLEAVARRIHDLLDHIERRRREVELAAAVIAHHDGRG